MIHCSFHTATRGYDHFNRLTDVNGYGYTYNARDQRTKQTLIDGQSWEYSYDELGQVIGGVKKTAAGAVVSGQNYAYAYDTVGNRETATANAVETNYTANQLNQYTAIGSVIPSYDVNGNQLTGYNGWTMEWNGENRLKAIYNATARLEFAYDYNGRRFSKKTYAKSGGNWVLSSEKKFIYDGFKQIAEYNGTALAQAYVWQPAGSGDFDVPLWMKAGGNVYTYLTDGNKNIRQLKTAAGTVVATYDYDPFGNVAATGSVSNNPWQFSSEFRDTETGLIYYNYRYYAPSIGRWINRDPIWEEGGLNLYMAGNNCLILYFDNIGYGFWSGLGRAALASAAGALAGAATGAIAGAVSGFIVGGPAGFVAGAAAGIAAGAIAGAITSGVSQTVAEVSSSYNSEVEAMRSGFLNGIAAGSMVGGSAGAAAALIKTGVRVISTQSTFLYYATDSTIAFVGNYSVTYCDNGDIGTSAIHASALVAISRFPAPIFSYMPVEEQGLIKFLYELDVMLVIETGCNYCEEFLWKE